jgi:hypothetical protein
MKTRAIMPAQPSGGSDLTLGGEDPLLGVGAVAGIEVQVGAVLGVGSGTSTHLPLPTPTIAAGRLPPGRADVGCGVELMRTAFGCVGVGCGPCALC